MSWILASSDVDDAAIVDLCGLMCALSARQERPVSAYIATGHLYTKQREA